MVLKPLTEPDDQDALVRRALDGDATALAELFRRHRKRLKQMIRLRLDRRLQGRVDPSDVIQEAYIDAAQKSRTTLPSGWSCRSFSGCAW